MTGCSEQGVGRGWLLRPPVGSPLPPTRRRCQLPPPPALLSLRYVCLAVCTLTLPTLACPQGYDELNTLERPLVSDVHEQEEYERAHGVSAPGAGTYAPPAATSGYAPPGYTPAAAYGAQPARHGAGMPAPPTQVRALLARRPGVV